MHPTMHVKNGSHAYLMQQIYHFLCSCSACQFQSFAVKTETASREDKCRIQWIIYVPLSLLMPSLSPYFGIRFSELPERKFLCVETRVSYFWVGLHIEGCDQFYGLWRRIVLRIQLWNVLQLQTLRPMFLFTSGNFRGCDGLGSPRYWKGTEHFLISCKLSWMPQTCFMKRLEFGFQNNSAFRKILLSLFTVYLYVYVK